MQTKYIAEKVAQDTTTYVLASIGTYQHKYRHTHIIISLIEYLPYTQG